MLTPQQRQQATDFCLEYEITRFWLLDTPLLNDSLGASAGPSAVVTFRPHWEAVPTQFARMERELAAITDAETALYSTNGLSPRFVAQILSKIPTALPDPDAPPISPEAVARFCRKRHITKMWLLDAPAPNAECDCLKPSVIVNTHPDHRMGLNIFDAQMELQRIIGIGATLYAYSSMLHPGIDAAELNAVAEVWYDDAP